MLGTFYFVPENIDIADTLFSEISNNTLVQRLAFQAILYNTLHFSSLRDTDVFKASCEKRGEPIDLAIFSWKRPGIDYSEG